jgi:hypothetical protein
MPGVGSGLDDQLTQTIPTKVVLCSITFPSDGDDIIELSQASTERVIDNARKREAGFGPNQQKYGLYELTLS